MQILETIEEDKSRIEENTFGNNIKPVKLLYQN
jgi:hypothetical protein